METQYFTVEEANALLPEIEFLMEQLLERRAKVIESRDLIAGILEDVQSNVGGPAASAMVQEFLAIERLAKKIRSHGCIIKDLNNGLVDFPSIREGREVYLCWRFGEPQIDFYHELHAGFKGRQQL
jgi:hypothetical protein